MADYTELATYVKNWANRDIDVLDYDLIRQCIRYAHDECYRTLRIAPLEITRSGTVTEAVANEGFLRTENDLVEFIQLRKVADRGPRSYSPYDKKYIVAEAHSDARSFQGDSVTLYSNYAFYREGYNIYIFPRIKADEVWELYYYRRLPEVNERFDVDELIANTSIGNSNATVIDISVSTTAVISLNGLEVDINRLSIGNKITITGAIPAEYNDMYEITEVVAGTGVSLNTILVTTSFDTSEFDPIDSMDYSSVRAAWNSDLTRTDFDRYFELVDEDEWDAIDLVDTTVPERMTLSELNLQLTYSSGEEYLDTDTFIGKLKEHWLRDINEKVLLFGALHQAFDYLDESDQSEKYKAKFEQEIAKLNKEDMDRMNSGGNIQTNFFNQLL